MKNLRRIGIPIILFVCIPALIALGVVFGDRSYNLISAAIALLACVPFFMLFESRQKSARELAVIAVMTATSVLSRLIFAPIPAFKPITAIVIIAGISLGGEAGFIVGALSALISNIYFGQGPWTPFQMFAWGALGFLTGLIAKTGVMKKWWALIIAGIVGGVLYSLMMDVWTVLALEGSFNPDRFFAAVMVSLPFMGMYALSNVIFLLLLAKPFAQRLERIKTKYGVFTLDENPSTE